MRERQRNIFVILFILSRVLAAPSHTRSFGAAGRTDSPPREGRGGERETPDKRAHRREVYSQPGFCSISPSLSWMARSGMGKSLYLSVSTVGLAAFGRG